MAILGWTLIHSLWQFMLIWAVLHTLLHWTPLRNSRLRYLLACVAMALMPLATLVTSVILQGNATPGGSDTFEIAGFTPAALTRLNSIMPAIAFAWIAGVAVFGVRLLVSFRELASLRRSAVLVDDPWTDSLNKMALSVGVTCRVMLAQSARIHAPVVIGLLKPLILVPIGMLGALTTAQVEAVLLHELMHIRRRDFLINLVQSVVEALFFFNPFCWWISDIIRREREHCCDDEVIRMVSPKVYANALVALAERSGTGHSVAPAFVGARHGLLTRIKRLFEDIPLKPFRYRLRSVITTATVLLLCMLSTPFNLTTIESVHRHAPAVEGSAEKLPAHNEIRFADGVSGGVEKQPGATTNEMPRVPLTSSRERGEVAVPPATDNTATVAAVPEEVFAFSHQVIRISYAVETSSGAIADGQEAVQLTDPSPQGTAWAEVRQQVVRVQLENAGGYMEMVYVTFEVAPDAERVTQHL